MSASRAGKSRSKDNPGGGKTNKPHHPTWLVATLAGALTGVGVFLSYPNFLGIELFPLQWVALIPTIWASRARSLKGVFVLWGWAGFVTNTGGFYWLDFMLQEFGHLPPPASVPVTLLMTAYQGLVFAGAGLVGAWLERRARVPLPFALPIGFVVAETLVPLVFPWYMANGQLRFIWASQIMDITGVAGLTFFIVWTNAALFEVGHRWPRHRASARQWATALLMAWAAVIGYGALRTAQVDSASNQAPKVRIGMVEANVGIWEKEAKSLPRELRGPTLLNNIIKHQRLSAKAVEQGAELIVWPESSYIPLGEVAAKRTDLFAVLVSEQGAVLEWRDNRMVSPPGLQKLGRPLRAVAAAREDRAIAVGDGGAALLWDGKAWQRVDADSAVDFGAVAAEALGERLWAGAKDGAIWRRQQGSWTLEARLTGGAVQAMAWDARSRAVLALTSDGTAHVGNDGNWRAAPGLAGSWQALAISGEGVGLVGGRGGRVAWREASAWREFEVSGLGDISAVWVVGRREFLAAGAGGLARFDGERWQLVEQPLGGNLRAVAGTEDGRIAVADSSGRMAWREEGEPWTIEQRAEQGAILAAAGVGFEDFAAIPADVAWFYRSRYPLPAAQDAAGAYEEEKDLPWRDRTALLRGFRAPMIFGAVLFEGEGGRHERRVYNVALLVEPRGKVLGRYDKNYLLIFGEYIPFGDIFPVLYDWIPEASHFTAGTTVEPFDWMGRRLGIMICYEDIIPRFTRRLSDKGTQVLINVTNDAWFGATAEPYLHLALAVARTIENRQWMVRSTNTGVSAFVDASGRLVAETSLQDEEILVADVPLLQLASVYRDTGDWFTVLVFAGALAGVLRARRLRPRRK